MLIDSHSHIDGAEFQLDIDEVFARMKEAEVGGALVAGTSLQDYERGLNFANAHKNVWYAAGVHPSTKDDDHEASIEELVGLTKPQKVVAIGECGLDYYYDYSPKDVQVKVFIEQIRAARETGLPLIIHTRDADDDTIAILDEEYKKGAFSGEIHCFSSSKKLADFALSIGFYISASGIITFNKSGELRDIFAEVPLDRLLVETDAPFLAPVPMRGRRNESSFVVHTAEKLAQIKDVPLEKLAQITSDNFYRLFRKASDKGRYAY